MLSSSTDKLSIVEAAASNGYEARIWDNQRQLLLKQGPEDVVFLLMNTIEEMSRRGTLETEIPEEYSQEDQCMRQWQMMDLRIGP